VITAEQKEQVQETWKLVEPISETAADLFYGKLFEIAPEVKPIFKSDIKEQGKKLMQMIGVAVAGLDNLGELTPAVAALGKRHSGYGVAESHYDSVGEALLWTLDQGLGEKFTDEVKQSWTTVYTTLAGVMIEASSESKAL